MDGFLSKKTVQAVKEIMESPVRKEKMTRKNYEIALRHYSYSVLQTHLNSILSNIDGQEYPQIFEESKHPVMFDVITKNKEPHGADALKSWKYPDRAGSPLKVANYSR